MGGEKSVTFLYMMKATYYQLKRDYYNYKMFDICIKVITKQSIVDTQKLKGNKSKLYYAKLSIRKGRQQEWKNGTRELQSKKTRWH